MLMHLSNSAYPDQGPKLRPEDPYLRARMRLAVDVSGSGLSGDAGSDHLTNLIHVQKHVSKNIIPAFFRLLQAQEDDKRDEARTELVKALDTFAKQLKGPYW